MLEHPIEGGDRNTGTHLVGEKYKVVFWHKYRVKRANLVGRNTRKVPLKMVFGG